MPVALGWELWGLQDLQDHTPLPLNAAYSSCQEMHATRNTCSDHSLEVRQDTGQLTAVAALQANCLWAHATLELEPPQEYLASMAERLMASLTAFAPQHLANSVWALASCAFHSKAGLAQAFANARTWLVVLCAVP